MNPKKCAFGVSASQFLGFLVHERGIEIGLKSQEAVLPWEITAGSRRVEFQNDLTTEQFTALMNENVEDLTELRLWSLEKIMENKAKVARAYNKKVKPKNFQVGDLVWEAVFFIGN